MRTRILCLALILSVAAGLSPTVEAGGFLKKLFGCKKDACCEPEPTCCEPAPEPICCEPAPEPEPVCCEPAPEPICCEPAPEPEPVCCEPAPEPICCEPAPEPEPICCEPAPEPEPVCCEPAPEPVCCEPAPEPEPCCASNVPASILDGLPEGSVVISMRVISTEMMSPGASEPVIVAAPIDNVEPESVELATGAQTLSTLAKLQR